MFRFTDQDFALDFYQRLHVARDASDDEIRKAYQKLAQKLHPDKNPDSIDSHAEFVAIGRAYKCLKDPAIRSQYDQRLGVTKTSPGEQQRYTHNQSTPNSYKHDDHRPETESTRSDFYKKYSYAQSDLEQSIKRYASFKKEFGYTDETISSV